MIPPRATNPASDGSFALRFRPPRNRVDPFRPHGFFVEEEPREGGGTERVATILLTNRECPWRCLMCDLWKNTLETPTPKGAIPAQIRLALRELPPAQTLKLYNAGSFFDRAAIPVEDHAEIASLARGFARVVVESHPALVGEGCLRFRELLSGPALEIALGLETANDEILGRLDKGMTVAEFGSACRFLAAHGIRIRTFLLVGLPFLRREEWAAATRVSVETSFGAGASVVSLIPTRLGNGALEELERRGEFFPPTLADLENAMGDSFERGIGRGLLLADLWDVDRLQAPPCCAPARVGRLREMNLLQRNLLFPSCTECGRHS